MNVHAQSNEGARKLQRAVAFHDVSMGSHAGMLSTICADRKHELSFDDGCGNRQRPAMRISERIAQVRKAAGWSQARLALEIGAAQTTVSSWERGRTEPTRDDVQRIARALRLSNINLEVATERSTVPLVGYVSAGAQAHYYAGGDDPGEPVEAPDNATERTVGVEVRGQSLGPLFERWIIYYDDVRSPVTPDLLGQLCVCALSDGQVLVKQIKAAATPNRFHLLSNAADPPMFDQEVIWAAKVTSMRPR